MHIRLTAACLLTGLLQAQQPAAALAQLIRDPAFASARVGVQVLDLAGGEVLCSHDAEQGFMTASNMKLISSFVALHTLGPEYRFRTGLVGVGRIEGSVLHGDLALVGSGDPTLGARQGALGPAAPFVRFAQALRARGIREVTGRVIGDDRCQAREPLGEGWSWNYESEAYAAQLSGLCFAENVVTCLLQATSKEVALQLVPDTGYVHVRCTALASVEQQPAQLQAKRERGSNWIEIAGAVPADGQQHTIKITVEDPARYAAAVLRETLQREGITVHGPAAVREALGADAGGARTLLAQHESAPLREILHTLNKVSQNLYAEQVIRAAARSAGSGDDMAAAASHATQVLTSFGVPAEGLRIADGSGLTRLNLAQPRQLAALLAAIWQSPLRDEFLATLPLAGVDGTLRSRFRDGPAHGRVRAKTGFIARVVALSGYVPRPDPQAPPLVFAILTNNFTTPTDSAKEAVDRFVQELSAFAGWK